MVLLQAHLRCNSPDLTSVKDGLGVVFVWVCDRSLITLISRFAELPGSSDRQPAVSDRP
ncbi:hypothetical protein [Microseira wollei]|uniref:hypothetical protein n=1 Tax=Microseira wollei TaxID=467598 RepID=UPI001CFDB569|nr:hypothetical protein [Microseira wollei]